MVDKKTSAFTLIGSLQIALFLFCCQGNTSKTWPSTREDLRHIFTLLENNRSREALVSLNKYRALYKESPLMAYAFGRAHAFEGHLRLSRQAYLRALEMEPELSEAIMDLAALDYYEGSLEKSYERLQSMVGSAEVSFAMSLVRLKQKNLLHANRYIDKALAFDGKRVKFWQLKALIAMALENYRQARHALRKIDELDPGERFVFMNLIYLAQKEGRIKEFDELIGKLRVREGETFKKTDFIKKLEKEFPFPPAEDILFLDYEGHPWKPGKPQPFLGDPLEAVDG
jgi:tetratricopeptide (TPR) repeat protein